MSLVRVTALCLLVTLSLPGQWDGVKSIAPGTEVRVDRTGMPSVRGPLKSATDEVVVVGTENLTRKDIARVAVKKKGHRGRNALIGAGVGAAGGAVVGGTAAKDGYEFFTRGQIAGILAACGAITGAIIGVLLPSGGWQTVFKR